MDFFFAFDFIPFSCLKATSSPAFAHNRMMKRKIRFVSSYRNIDSNNDKDWHRHGIDMAKVHVVACMCESNRVDEKDNFSI